jgi:BMFP domain-containing protein YqiC
MAIKVGGPWSEDTFTVLLEMLSMMNEKLEELEKRIESLEKDNKSE